MDDLEEKIMEAFYKTAVTQNLKIYKEMYEFGEHIDERLHKFYKKICEEKQEENFYLLMKSIIIDSLSQVFGIIDGTSTLSGVYGDFELKYDGEKLKYLQDTFLEYVEETT